MAVCGSRVVLVEPTSTPRAAAGGINVSMRGSFQARKVLRAAEKTFPKDGRHGAGSIHLTFLSIGKCIGTMLCIKVVKLGNELSLLGEPSIPETFLTEFLGVG